MGWPVAGVGTISRMPSSSFVTGPSSSLREMSDGALTHWCLGRRDVDCSCFCRRGDTVEERAASGGLGGAAAGAVVGGPVGAVVGGAAGATGGTVLEKSVDENDDEATD
jgi:hypothetical protein